jgi:uncharacterized membrane protein
MSSKVATITVLGSREELERLWRELAAERGADVQVSFAQAPGDRGTEIRVEVPGAPTNPVGQAVKKVSGSDPLAKAKDELRHFKQLFETGVIARSEGTPEGEAVERKLKQRPAQPLEQSERQKAGV